MYKVPDPFLLIKEKRDRIRGRRKGGREIEEKEEEERESIRNTFIPFYDTAFFLDETAKDKLI